MKKITLTHATVVPFLGKNADQVIEVRELESGTTIINFNIKTKATDSPKSQAYIYEKCTVYAKSPEHVQFVKQNVVRDAVLKIEAHEERSKGKEGGKYFANTVVDKILPIAGGEESVPSQSDEEDLPF